MNKWNYFTESEVQGLEPEFIAKLEIARKKAAVEFVITSGKRSPEDNERAMGVESSAHVKGLGIDLRCSDSSARFHILEGLLFAGFTRIGIYDKHIHADADTSKDQCVIWMGVSH